MKKIIAAAAILITATAHSQDFIPFNEWESKNPNWSSQPTEIFYMLGRCASAFMVMSSYIKENANGEIKLQNDAKFFMDRATSFAALSIQVGTAIGATEKFLANRINEISKIYANDIVKSKTITNDAFSKNFQTDINFCTQYYPEIFNSDGTPRKP